MEFEDFIKDPMEEINSMLHSFGLSSVCFENRILNKSFNSRQVKLCRWLNNVFNKHCSGRNWVELFNDKSR